MIKTIIETIDNMSVADIMIVVLLLIAIVLCIYMLMSDKKVNNPLTIDSFFHKYNLFIGNHSKADISVILFLTKDFTTAVNLWYNEEDKFFKLDLVSENHTWKKTELKCPSNLNINAVMQDVLNNIHPTISAKDIVTNPLIS